MSAASSSYGGLLWVGVAGFAAGFVLAKLKVATDKNSGTIATWASGAIAAFFALAADTSTQNAFVELGGRVAIFFIVWVMLGIVFTFGFIFGVEKAGGDKK
jgi:hypothetical protein